MDLNLKNPGRGQLIGLAALAAASIICALVGWVQVGLPITDVVFRSLKGFEMAEAYDEVASKYQPPPRPRSPSGADAAAISRNEEKAPVRRDVWHGNAWLEAARFLGVVFTSFAGVVIFITLADDQIIGLTAQWRRKHILIVGQSEFAMELSETLLGQVIHMCPPAETGHRHGHMIRLPLKSWSADHLKHAAALHASKLLIAPEDDDAAIDLALGALRIYPDVQTFVRVKNYGLAQRIQLMPGAERLRSFTEVGVAAREIVHRHPPFLLANDQGHRRVHALLIGDHNAVEALMAEILASALTLTYGRPAFSFVCEAADLFEERLCLRYPELQEAADLSFYQADRLNHAPTSRTDLSLIASRDPISCVYIALKQEDEVLAAALTFRERATKATNFTAPIFVLSRKPNGLLPPKPGDRLDSLTLVPFGWPEQISRALGLMSDEADIAEREFHNAYREFASPDGEASKPWNDLKEEYRISNARAVAHIYAKLFEAGFDLRTWMLHTKDIWSELPALAPGEALWRNETQRAHLAELEHARWIADRRLNGWSYGAERDNEKKLHPDIRPFAELSPEVQAYDHAFIAKLQVVLENVAARNHRVGRLRRLVS